MNLWALVLLTIVGCYALKLVGYLLPARVLEHRRTRRLVELLPVALVVVQAVAVGEHLDLDVARLIGFGVAAVAIWRRAPFLVIVVVAAATTALLRLAFGLS